MKDFTNKSRRNLMRDLSTVRTDTNSRTCSLTLPGEDPGVEAFTEAFQKLQRVWSNKWKKVGAHWKREPQKRGAMHMHLIVYLDKLNEKEIEEFRLWLFNKWYKLIGGGDSKHLRWHLHEKNWQPPRSGMAGYFAKYIGKVPEGENVEANGRWWGVISRKNIPYGEKKVIQVDRAAATKAYRWARKLRQRKGEIAKRRFLFRKLLGDVNAEVKWEDLCQGHGGARDPALAQQMVGVFKVIAKNHGLSWSRPKLPKHGSIFLVLPDAPGVAERLIDHAVSLSRAVPAERSRELRNHFFEEKQ